MFLPPGMSRIRRDTAHACVPGGRNGDGSSRPCLDDTTALNLPVAGGLASFFREVTPHSFRHGLGMRAVKSGIHARHIQKILGHKSIASSQCYMDVDDDDLAAAYGRISERGLTTSGEAWDN